MAMRWPGYVVIPVGVVLGILAIGVVRYVLSSAYWLYDNQRDAAPVHDVLLEAKVADDVQAQLREFYWRVRWRALMAHNLTWRWDEAGNQQALDALQAALLARTDLPPETRAAVLAWGGIYGRIRVDEQSIAGLKALADTTGWTNAAWRDEDRYKLLTVLLIDMMGAVYDRPEKQYDSWLLTAGLYAVGGSDMMILDRMHMGGGPVFPPYMVPQVFNAVVPIFRDLAAYPERSPQRVFVFDVGAHVLFLDIMRPFTKRILGTNEPNCGLQPVRDYAYIDYVMNQNRDFALSRSGYLRNRKLAEMFDEPYFGKDKNCKEF